MLVRVIVIEKGDLRFIESITSTASLSTSTMGRRDGVIFDHEKLDVYRVALEFVAWVFSLVKCLSGANRHSRDHLIKASQSITQNIAEGNGKRSMRDRRRFFEIARGSALECASILDILLVCEAITVEENRAGKKLLHRIVSMLTRMTEIPEELHEGAAEYLGLPADYDYEHRFAEHEHERRGE